MNRRQFLVAASATATSLAGCIGGTAPADEASPGTGSTATGSSACGTDETSDGPQSSVDSLQLHAMPDYVADYDASVVVKGESLGAAARRAVEAALDADGAYRECAPGSEESDVMALFGHVERRWEETDGESFEHTYLRYGGTYYGITLVQEGDFVRVDSVPCTSEACPTTPTPPP